MERDKITSQQNKIIKHVKGLQAKKNRRLHKQFVIEGIRVLEECLLHQIPIHYVFYTEDLVKLQGGGALLEKVKKDYRSYEITRELLLKISDTENPQGIIAVVSMPENNLQSIKISEDAFFVILDRVQDPGNMGTILRTAEAAGADGIILTKGCVDPYNSKTIRATMGALLHIPVIETNSNEEWINILKDNSVKLIASDLDTPKTYLDVDYKNKIAIIIGNEANGIDETLLEKADELVKIPILGKIESLNASVAAAILIYKVVEAKGL
ncbi:TrmH family RNA methyltransferase [Natronincola ferrireducens]|uniref:RNA methyltransferase, TrmH family n=1 Tax=Natronincola ferrireducens TaxID=393762 RepID=A0A1G9EG61_9FIRM|nr:RNA methyltransferase [Natronincola ferrireducens]SDK75106.1 RNA methyltransferase, TrmH family [Natronincola ferrireducens]